MNVELPLPLAHHVDPFVERAALGPGAELPVLHDLDMIPRAPARQVTKRFADRMVLNGVSLELAAGEYIAIIGDSGIGKSTLLNVIAGLEPVDSGKVRFDGNRPHRHG